MKDLRQKVVAITGAASGIGQALAIAFAKEGCQLALSDINELGLQETVNQVKALGTFVTFQRLDVSNREDMEGWAARIEQEHGGINVIVNNAGVALCATIEDVSYDDMAWLMGINFWGVVYGTKTFLPYLQKSNEGHIVNISSLFGIVSIPTLSAYSSAKFAVRGFTESLRQELEISNSHVSCTSVHPGGIKTNIARSAPLTKSKHIPMNKAAMDSDFDKLAQTTPSQAAKKIIKGIKQNKRRVLVGGDAHVIDFIQRLLPTAYQKMVMFAMKKGI